MLKTIEKALLLQEIDILKFASTDHLMQLAEAGHEEIFKKGAILAPAGEPSLNCYLLLLGCIAPEGAEKPIMQKTAVNLFPCLAGTSPRFGYACLEDCTVLAISTTDLLDLLSGEPELSLALLKYFASKQMQSP
jgi:hypothetical protein